MRRSVALQGGSVPDCLINEELHLTLLRHLEQNPDSTQRELAKQMGVSLGKANYCLRSLIAEGFVNARSFTNSRNKHAYMYVLTPMGMKAKTELSARFLRSKIEEYQALREEIEELGKELEEKTGLRKP